jgi:galactokinase
MSDLPRDLEDFLADLNNLGGPFGRAIDPKRPCFVGRAPGRLDVLGGIADYSGSLCLELPLREAACAAVQARGDGTFVVLSPGDEMRGERFVTSADCLSSIEALRAATADATWVRYLLGPLLLLAHEHGAAWRGGATIVLRSQVPEGAGVSSSAAVEVSVLVAAAAVAGVTLSPRDTALLAQRVENLVVGAPCGVMDQCTVACGEADALLRLLCQPCELQGQVRLPTNLAVWGINSGERHSVGGSDYSSVRAACAMGTRILAEHFQATITPSEPGRVHIAKAPWHDHLVNLSPAQCDERLLPEQLSGAEFLTTYHGIADPIAQIDPKRSYAVRACTMHPILEHQRVCQAAELLPLGSDDAARRVGEMMFASHASYSHCGLGAKGPDRLVALVREAMTSGAPLFGAKITGGGSGGTVAILGRPEAEPLVRDLAQRYAEEAGFGGYVFAGSSPGACFLGSREVRKSGSPEVRKSGSPEVL